MLQSLRLSRNLVSRRAFTSASIIRADKASGGFGEEARQKQGQDPVKDTAPYQNEYTKSGTNSEVAHNDESYSSNTNPEQSNARQGEALDGSPANKAYSDDYTPKHSNKTHRDSGSASSMNQSSGTQGNNSGNSGASEADVSKSKFDTLSKNKEDVQQVGGRKVTN